MNRRQSVITWYSRAPTTPAGTATIAIADMSSGLPPAATHRLFASHTAATTPSAIIRPYARSCSPPMWIAFELGLGMEASTDSIRRKR